MFSDYAEVEDSDLGDVDYRTRHSQRCKQLGLKDPVYATSLKDCVAGQFMLAKSQLGGERYQGLMQTIAVEDLENLADYFDLGLVALPSSQPTRN